MIVDSAGAVVDEFDVHSELAGVSRADTDYECRHGRLVGDACPSPRVRFTSGPFKGRVVQDWPHPYVCGCFASELPSLELVTPEPTPDLMRVFALVKEDAQKMLSAAPELKLLAAPPARRRVTAVAHITSPLLERVVRELDTEIARLTVARDALIEACA